MHLHIATALQARDKTGACQMLCNLSTSNAVQSNNNVAGHIKVEVSFRLSQSLALHT